MKKLVAVTGLWVLVALSGCATLFGGGGKQQMTFNSTPEGATVLINNVPVGQTPVTMPVVRDSKATVISFKKDGYKDQVYPLQHHLNPWFWGDVVALSLLSTTVDTATDSTVEYNQDHFFVTLEPLNAPAASNGVQDKRTAITQFVVSNYAQIIVELNTPNAQGEHIATLLSLLGVTPANHDSAVATLRDLSNKTKNAPDFGNGIVEKFAL